MAAPLLWGTTRTRPAHLGGAAYQGRVHIVRPGQRRVGWCGLPMDAVWPERPPPRPRDPIVICPECAIDYLAETYPQDPAPWAQTQTIPAVRGGARQKDTTRDVEDHEHQGRPERDADRTGVARG